MTYRDDRDALRAEIQRLEQRLEESAQTVAQLRGDAAPSAFEGVKAFRALALERVLPVELGEGKAREVERLLRARLPAGMQVQREGVAVTASATGLSIALEALPDGARLRMVEDVTPWRRTMALVAVSLLMTLVGSLPLALRGSGVASALATFAVLVAISAPILAAWSAKRRRRELARTFEACAFVLREGGPRGTSVRVAAEPDAAARESLVQAEAEALQGEELGSSQDVRRTS